MLAIEAGCDVVLICSGDYDVQAGALEALTHRVETDAAFLRRVEDALQRNRRVKARYLAPSRTSPLTPKALGQVLGQEEHRRTADAMARFA